MPGTTPAKPVKLTLKQKKHIASQYIELYLTEKNFQNQLRTFSNELEKKVLPTLVRSPDKEKLLSDYINRLNGLISSFEQRSKNVEKILGDLINVDTKKLGEYLLQRTSEMTDIQKEKFYDSLTNAIEKWSGALANNQVFGNNLLTMAAAQSKDQLMFDRLKLGQIFPPVSTGIDSSNTGHQQYSILVVQRAPRYILFGKEILAPRLSIEKEEIAKNDFAKLPLLEFGANISSKTSEAIQNDENQIAQEKLARKIQLDMASYLGHYIEHHRISVTKKAAEALGELAKKISTDVTGKANYSPYQEALQILQKFKEDHSLDSKKSSINIFAKHNTLTTVLVRVEKRLKDDFIANLPEGTKPATAEAEWKKLVTNAKTPLKPIAPTVTPSA